jgi:hypothetical protein
MSDLAGRKSSAQKKQDDAQKKEEENKVTGYVKFRPCKDWCGEYGFDWVREGRDDYDERKELLLEKFEEPDRFIKGEMIRKHFLKKDPVNGEKKYEEWQDEVRKKAEKQADKNIKEHGGESKEYEMGCITDECLDAYIKKNKLKYDSEAWQKKTEVEIDKDLHSGDDEYAINMAYLNAIIAQEITGDTTVEDFIILRNQPSYPMEYAYPAEFVEKVVYEVDRMHYGHVWVRSEYKYHGMENGDIAINAKGEKKAEKLNYFAYIKSNILSLYGGDDGVYSAPIYMDTDEVGKMGDISRINHVTWSDTATIKGERKSIAKWLKDDFLQNGNDFFHLNVNAKVVSKTVKFIIKDKQKVKSYEFRYFTFGGKQYTGVCVIDNGKKYECVFVNGKLETVLHGTWRSVKDLKKNKDNKPFIEEFEKAIKELLPDDMVNNKNMSIEKLIKMRFDGKEMSFADFNIGGNLDKIRVSVYYPVRVIKYQLEKDNDYFVKEEKYYLGREDDKCPKYEIETWKEKYEKYFHPFFIRYKEPVKYCVPVLSSSYQDGKRTRFTFRGGKDAPKKEVEKKREFKLQLRVVDDCPLVQFRYNRSAFKVTPEVLKNPKDGDTITIELLNGNPRSNPFIYAMDKECVKDGIYEIYQGNVIGRLEVRIPEQMRCPVSIIRVNEPKKSFSSEFLNALQDNIDFLETALLQAGIELDLFYPAEIDMTPKEIEKFKPHNKWDNTKEGLSSLLINKFVKAYPTQIKYHYSILVFVFNSGSANPDVPGLFEIADKDDNRRIIKINNFIETRRQSSWIITHEICHALRCPHSFQLNGNYQGDMNNRFCFPISSTSNIMDYYVLTYSLNKYQWEAMATGLKGFIQEMEPKIKKAENEAKKNQ